MAIRRYKPTSPARRFMSVSMFDEITTTKPEKSLLAPKQKTGGRNLSGKITVRHIGGGNRNKYRIIDFKRQCHPSYRGGGQRKTCARDRLQEGCGR